MKYLKPLIWNRSVITSLVAIVGGASGNLANNEIFCVLAKFVNYAENTANLIVCNHGLVGD